MKTTARKFNTAEAPEEQTVRDHMIAAITSAALERDPFCHIYTTAFFPDEVYPRVLRALPDPSIYEPINLRNWSRPDGTSTRDQFYFTPENIAKLPAEHAALWNAILGATKDEQFKRAVFKKLAPDLALRFGVREDEVADIPCVHDVLLYRDTQDYRIKPHPDGLNKIVTLQIYLPPDDTTDFLGTSLYRRKANHLGNRLEDLLGTTLYKRHKPGDAPELLGSRFEEVKRFPFLPNSAYAFPVSDSKTRRSLHGRELISGFNGVRNTMMVMFQVNDRDTRRAKKQGAQSYEM